MTLPDERYRAVLAAHRLLTDLVVPQRSPRVPTEIRHRAQSALRHYPSTFDMDRVCEAAPGIFQERLEPLYGMVKQYDAEKNANSYKCNACGCTYTDDEGGVEGDFGILPMCFCPTCFSCMCDMASQYMGISSDEIDFLNEQIANLKQANQDLKFQLIEKTQLLDETKR
jgi:hypothetical protein